MKKNNSKKLKSRKFLKYINLGVVSIITGGLGLTLASCAWTDNNNILLVTDGGQVTDKSFNQSSWEALQAMNKKDKNIKIGYNDPVNTNKGTLNRVYEILSKSYSKKPGAKNIMVLSGFLNELNGEVTKFAKKNPEIQFLGVDFDQPAESKITNFTGLLFDATQSGFLAALYAGLYFNANSSSVSGGGYDKVGNTINMASFGGVDIPPVYSYMNGYLAGSKYFNDNIATIKNLPIHDKKTPVKKIVNIFQNGKSPSAKDFTGDFKADNKKISPLTKNYLNQGANLIMPVAGPQIAQAMANVNGRNQWVIGVDSDQTKVYPNTQNKIFGSALKGIKDAVLTSIENIYAGRQAKKNRTPFNFKDNKKGLTYIGFKANTQYGGQSLEDQIKATQFWKDATKNGNFYALDAAYKGGILDLPGFLPVGIKVKDAYPS